LFLPFRLLIFTHEIIIHYLYIIWIYFFKHHNIEFYLIIIKAINALLFVIRYFILLNILISILYSHFREIQTIWTFEDLCGWWYEHVHVVDSMCKEMNSFQ
jgi:hypothetical protein